jgi:(2Fe-2S) ferredoxin
VSYFQHHVFFCTNARDDDRQSCAQCGSQSLRDYMKARCKALGISGPGKARINSAGCMDRCAQGPVIVVYPEAVWYTYVDRLDIDEIIDSHLLQGKVVERLKLDQEA